MSRKAGKTAGKSNGTGFEFRAELGRAADRDGHGAEGRRAPDAAASKPEGQGMEYFLQQLINGLTLGAIYGLIAIGYTMVYGIIGMINFAHGDVFMIGAFIAVITIIALGLTASAGLPVLLLALLLVL